MNTHMRMTLEKRKKKSWNLMFSTLDLFQVSFAYVCSKSAKLTFESNIGNQLQHTTHFDLFSWVEFRWVSVWNVETFRWMCDNESTTKRIVSKKRRWKWDSSVRQRCHKKFRQCIQWVLIDSTVDCLMNRRLYSSLYLQCWKVFSISRKWQTNHVHDFKLMIHVISVEGFIGQ